ncbi:MAG: SHOCT domain-containing protein [Thermoleophilia bacterium]|jgi:hypothetical protein|nr:SHOCT domain-containing protein [Thermoleophilia bacterium]
MTTAQVVRRVVLQFVGLAGLVACLVILFLSMRAVMDIGGSCASGGPYVIANECPDGIAWLTPLSIFAGLGFLALYGGSCFSDGGPRLVLLAWPALFLSLGWNFLEYGLRPPGGDGIVWGWLVCGVLFWAMGGLPMLALLKPGVAWGLMWGGPPRAEGAPARVGVRDHLGAISPRIARPLGVRPHRRRHRGRPAPAPGPPRTASRDLLGRIERLDALRRGGAVDAEEYERLKDALMREEGLVP